MEKYKKEAVKTAQKLCNSDCVSGVDCGLEHNPRTSLIDDTFVCPLQKYQVTNRTTPDPFSGNRLTETDIFFLCADCENGEVTETPNEEVVGPIDETKCLDCPVGMAWEAILEADAEAAMS